MAQTNPRPTSDRNPAAPSPYSRCYNVATEFILCLTRLVAGMYPVAFLATPPAVTEQYLELLALCLRKQCIVVAEKPWVSSFASALRLEKLLKHSSLCVRYNDHYLAKQVVMWLVQQPLASFLGGPIISVKARLFETAGHLSPAMGTTGMLNDLLIHLVTVVHRLFPNKRISVVDADAARHTDWPYASESYTSVNGGIDTGRSWVTVNLAAGKDLPKAEKVMLIEGPERTLRVDFAQDRAELLSRDGSCRLLFPEPTTKPEKPYAYLLRRLHEGDVSIGLASHEALAVLHVLDAAKRLFPNPLPSYEKGALPPGS